MSAHLPIPTPAMADRFVLNPIKQHPQAKYFIVRRLGNIEMVVGLSFIIYHQICEFALALCLPFYQRQVSTTVCDVLCIIVFCVFNCVVLCIILLFCVFNCVVLCI